MFVLDEPIVSEHDAGNRRHEECVSRHEVQERQCATENDPGYHGPAADKNCEDDTTPDVEVFWTESCDIWTLE
jgi:hypothetical protein